MVGTNFLSERNHALQVAQVYTRLPLRFPTFAAAVWYVRFTSICDIAATSQTPKYRLFRAGLANCPFADLPDEPGTGEH